MRAVFLSELPLGISDTRYILVIVVQWLVRETNEIETTRDAYSKSHPAQRLFKLDTSVPRMTDGDCAFVSS